MQFSDPSHQPQGARTRALDSTTAGTGSRETRWWQRAVIYRVYPRSFQDSNDDGIGDLAGVTCRLPYLKALGVDAIWLSPIFPSPMRDFGYDISAYTDIDPIFGTLSDFDILITAAHGLKLKVLLRPRSEPHVGSTSVVCRKQVEQR